MSTTVEDGVNGNNEDLNSILKSPLVEDLSDIPLPDGREKPSLESILNQEDELLSLEDLGITDLDLIQDDSTQPTPSFATDTDSKTSVLSKSTSEIDKDTVATITRLELISKELKQVLSRGTGQPTSVAVGKYMAVGLSTGTVLIFDIKQQLKACLIPPSGPEKFGAVSAVTINFNSTRLLVGYAKGPVTKWDLTNFQCLQECTTGFPPGHAVLQVKFTNSPSTAVFLNSGGSIFVLEFSKMLGLRSYSAHLVFSGSHGEACYMEPLCLPDQPNYILNKYFLLVIATVSKMMVVTFKPTVKLLTTLSLQTPPKYLPLLSWQFCVVRTNTGTTVDPILTCVRGDQVTYVQAHVSTPNAAPTFSVLKHIKFPYNILSFHWLTSQLAVLLDSKEFVHIVHVRSAALLQKLDVSHVELIYSSSVFKSLATGGNVSQALRAGANNACHNSITVDDCRMYILGISSVTQISLLSWEQRINRLSNNNDFESALTLAGQFYKGTSKAIAGLSGSRVERQRKVAAKITDLIGNYVPVYLGVNCEFLANDVEKLTAYFTRLAQVCIESCILISDNDLLLASIYNEFCTDYHYNMQPVNSREVFLDTLQAFIVSNRIPNLSPIVAKDFVDFYIAAGKVYELEKCLVHMRVKNLNIQKLIVFCWKNALYDALLSVYNTGLNDYTSPLVELLLQLRSAMKGGQSLSDEYQKMGYKLLVYISGCLAGRAYPKGDIPKNYVKAVKSAVYKTLLAKKNEHDTSDQASYPFLHTLLHFDTREFLNVLSLAFEEQDFGATEGIPTRQAIVDILLEIMVGERKSFAASQIGSLFTFLARHTVRHKGVIHVDQRLYDQVVEFLTNPDESVRHYEREHALLELYNSDALVQFDEEKLLALAEKAKFYRVCEVLYGRKRQFSNVLSCYWRDPNRKTAAFSYIHQIMSGDERYSEAEREEVEKVTMEHMELLVSTDTLATARLVLLDFPHCLLDITHKLRRTPETLYKFLEGIFNTRLSSSVRGDFIAPPQVSELYIDLLCRYNFTGVVEFLKTNENYRVDETLKVVRKYKILDASVYLLERVGEVKEAFQNILSVWKGKMKATNDRFSHTTEITEDLKRSVSQNNSIMNAMVELCERNAYRLPESSREELWYSLLDEMISHVHQSKNWPNKPLVHTYQDMLSKLLNSMTSHLSLTTIVTKVLTDEAYSSGHFKDVKGLIMGMLETYNYEETLHKTTNHILFHDVRNSLDQLHKMSQKGLSPESTTCAICSRQALAAPQPSNKNPTKDNVVVFSCSHLFHETCIYSTASIHTNWAAGSELFCPLCSNKRAAAKQHTSDSNKPSLSRKMTMVRRDTFTRAAIKHKQVKEEGSAAIELDPQQMANLQRIRHQSLTSYDQSDGPELNLAPPPMNV
ncbi:vacuolar protein sorting-associated protein 8 homolog isoform X2 [Dysidea avara]|uniref:vacuolar protein sorting-associated protein 8 homolog isoform X2 n=1 Tax=Dysidea avara TaxID=196820 RepID=UPI0033288759